MLLDVPDFAEFFPGTVQPRELVSLAKAGFISQMPLAETEAAS